MGDPQREEAAAASGGRSVGRKHDLGWKMIGIVTTMAVIGVLQLIVMEKTWWISRSTQSPHTVVAFGNVTTGLSSSATSALHAERSPEADSLRTQPRVTDSADSDKEHPSELQAERNDTVATNRDEERPSELLAQRNDAIVTDPDKEHPSVVQAQRYDTIVTNPENPKLLEFSPSSTFLPMKDVTQEGLSNTDTNWFMSGLRGRNSVSGETFDLPGDDPIGRFLCVRGTDPQDGTKNSYGLFLKVPTDAILLPGTTFIADNYWEYQNPWHAMSTLVNFATWRMDNQCAVPDRLLLYHMGELVSSMGDWITNVLHAAFMKPIPVETLTLRQTQNQQQEKQSSAVCFERAVVQRRGISKMDTAHIHRLFDMLRCKARRHCKIPQRQGSQRQALAVLLLTRREARAFANESGVAAVVRQECDKVPGCSLRVVDAGNLTFCEQVMSATDVMISVHGAQLTNLMFMDPGSRLMELFPKGWKETAGIGQEIYKWHADWNRIIHVGRWRDPVGPDCPFPSSETLQCFFFFKDRKLVSMLHTFQCGLALYWPNMLKLLSFCPK